jgi:hypothetical protein
MATGDFLKGFAEQQMSPDGFIGGQLDDINQRKKTKLLLQLKSALIEQEMNAKSANEAQKFQNEGFASPEVSSFLAGQAGMQPGALPKGFKASEKDAAILAGLAGKKLTANGKAGPKGFMGHEANLFLGSPVFADDEFVPQNRYNAAKDQVLREQASPAAKQQFTSIQDARKYVQQMKSTYDELSGQGQTGPVVGNIINLANKVTGGSANPKAAAYMDTRLGLAGRMKGVAGEAGRLTDQDVERMLGLVSGIEKGQVRSDEGFKQINDILNGGESNILNLYPTFKRQVQSGSQPSSGANDSDSILNTYIQGVKAARLAKQQGKQ